MKNGAGVGAITSSSCQVQSCFACCPARPRSAGGGGLVRGGGQRAQHDGKHRGRPAGPAGAPWKLDDGDGDGDSSHGRRGEPLGCAALCTLCPPGTESRLGAPRHLPHAVLEGHSQPRLPCFGTCLISACLPLHLPNHPLCRPAAPRPPAARRPAQRAQRPQHRAT